MISAKRAATIIFEVDRNKRNKLIDKLSEEDAKYLLMQYLAFINDTSPTFEDKLQN